VPNLKVSIDNSVAFSISEVAFITLIAYLCLANPRPEMRFGPNTGVNQA